MAILCKVKKDEDGWMIISLLLVIEGMQAAVVCIVLLVRVFINCQFRFAGDSHPKVLFSNYVGSPKHVKV